MLSLTEPMKGGWMRVVCFKKKKLGSGARKGSLDAFGQISGPVRATGGYKFVFF